MNISVALGGGGAKGNSHIGVLRRLEKEGFHIKAVAGTSFGAIVAAFYAKGLSPDEIEEIFSYLDQTQLYGHAHHEQPSLFGLAGGERFFRSHFDDLTFADLKIPCAMTAVDLACGCEVILSEGSVAEALLATVAVPGFLPSRRTGQSELVDGGVLNPVPVSLARALAPNLPVVAVPLSLPLGLPAKPWTLPVPSLVPRPVVERLARINYAQAFGIFMRSLDIVDRALAEYRLEVDKPDVIIRPAVHEIEVFDRVDVHTVAQLGERAVEAMLPELNRMKAWPNRLRHFFRVT